VHDTFSLGSVEMIIAEVTRDETAFQAATIGLW